MRQREGGQHWAEVGQPWTVFLFGEVRGRGPIYISHVLDEARAAAKIKVKRNRPSGLN